MSSSATHSSLSSTSPISDNQPETEEPTLSYNNVPSLNIQTEQVRREDRQDSYAENLPPLSGSHGNLLNLEFNHFSRSSRHSRHTISNHSYQNSNRQSLEKINLQSYLKSTESLEKDASHHNLNSISLADSQDNLKEKLKLFQGNLDSRSTSNLASPLNFTRPKSSVDYLAHSNKIEKEIPEDKIRNASLNSILEGSFTNNLANFQQDLNLTQEEEESKSTTTTFSSDLPEIHRKVPKVSSPAISEKDPTNLHGSQLANFQENISVPSISSEHENEPKLAENPEFQSSETFSLSSTSSSGLEQVINAAGLISRFEVPGSVRRSSIKKEQNRKSAKKAAKQEQETLEENICVSDLMNKFESASNSNKPPMPKKSKSKKEKKKEKKAKKKEKKAKKAKKLALESDENTSDRITQVFKHEASDSTCKLELIQATESKSSMSELHIPEFVSKFPSISSAANNWDNKNSNNKNYDSKTTLAEDAAIQESIFDSKTTLAENIEAPGADLVHKIVIFKVV